MFDLDEARLADAAACLALRNEIDRIARDLPPVALMEVCGTHTTAFFRHGVRGMLPASVRLISGPGCPVCVTPTSYVDLALRLMREPGVALATFGDMIRVPGSATSIEREKGRGGRVHIVYSAMDALALARSEPRTTFVFLAVGFETTAPTIAQTVVLAEKEGVANLRLLVGHKLVPPALRALLSHPELRIDGFILPGHVSVIIGSESYRFVSEEFGVPGAICGFEPVDLLKGVLSLLDARRTGRPAIANLYGRFVKSHGNRAALSALDSIFETVDTEWRGLGRMPASGLALRPSLRHRDAALLLGDDEIARLAASARDDAACRCGEVLCGTILPTECGLFGSGCTPETPVGPCMVSTEGTCAAYFRYGRQA
ncbi:MAG: hydrogenase formation protein HypD [Candidatus Eisenbacteria bacterium]|nr:hydrogenase formation protein HypD [Candidatus Eisenbacteria bacterium]